MRREGVEAADEVLLVPVGAWVAESGPLRPGLETIATQLLLANVNIKISKKL